jgi:hypothetical protein
MGAGAEGTSQVLHSHGGGMPPMHIILGVAMDRTMTALAISHHKAGRFKTWFWAIHQADYGTALM